MAQRPTDDDLNQFCAAVREKQDWKSKILNEKLALKWAREAEIILEDTDLLAGEALEALNELQREARRVRLLDKEIARGDPIVPTNEESISRIDKDFKNALKYARASKYGLRAPDLKESGLGVIVSDDLVPESVHRELVRELDTLAAREPRDFHPGSFGKVQDLIHPSLYPYIADVSPTVSADVKLPPTRAGKFKTGISRNETEELSSSYAWIPSVFQVSPDGTDVHIESYINGLGTREQFPSLFRAIEKVFLLALPHFEKTMIESETYKGPTAETPSVKRWDERRHFFWNNEGSLTREQWEAYLEQNEKKWDAEKKAEQEAKQKEEEEMEQEKVSFQSSGDEFAPSTQYKSKKLKVIVKAANYTLKPGREYSGTWHMEGMPHERIVASVIYYYDTDDTIVDKGLGLRKFRNEEKDFPDCSRLMHEDFVINFVKEGDEDEDEDEDEYFSDSEKNYPSDWETYSDREGNIHHRSTTSLAQTIELGIVPTTNFGRKGGKGTGRMLSFPNWIQHKVESVKNTSDSGDAIATRKILCFFLVDDTMQDDRISYHGFSYNSLKGMNVLTTSQIPMQMQTCNLVTMHKLLPKVSTKLTGRPLPPELVEIIWRYASAGTFSREEAENHRRGVMSDRKVRSAPHRRDDTFSLCEH